MRVRILVGHQAGLVQDVSQAEGEHMLVTSFAELAPIAAAADVAPPKPEGGSLTDDADLGGEPAPEVPSVPAARVRRPRQTTLPDPASRRKRR